MTGIYIRVSTQEQTNGYSIDEQKQRLQAYCAAMGWEYRFFTDPGFSGGNTERPGLTELITEVENKRLNRVIVYKLDRLSRSQLDTLFLIERVFLRNNCDFVSLTENFDTSSPFGRAMIGILAVFAQLEREQIKERMTMGREARAKEGKWHGCGNSPIGYDYINGELIINTDEAIQVKEVFHLCKMGKSRTEIANILNRDHTTKYGKWSAQRVKDVLINPLYAGYIQTVKGTYKGIQQPIIAESEFSKISSIVKADVESLSSKRQQSLLGGIIFCAKCGSRYSATSTPNNYGGPQYRYYKCLGRCGAKSHRQTEIDNNVIEYFKKLRFDPDLLKAHQKPIKEEKNALEAEIKRLSGQKERLVHLYSGGVVPFDDVKRKISEIDTEIAKLSEKLSKNAEILSKNEKFQQISDYPSPYEALTRATEERKRLILHQLIEKILISDNRIEILFKL